MKKKLLVVLLDGKMLIAIPDVETWQKDIILDAYAKHYAFDRKKLEGFFLDTIDNPVNLN